MDYNFTCEKLLEGEVLPFNKPYKWTSFQLVNKIRYELCKHAGIKKLKVGHAGTLDPLATGLLILCTGKATKSIDNIQSQHKEYIAEITFGATTPSFDLETPIDKTYSTAHITIEMIKEKLVCFIGEISQVPPLFSAKNIDGVRAYKYARQGMEKEIKSSIIEIYNIELMKFNAPVLTLSIKCSKGTYIRSLARDLGLGLNSGGHLTALQRTAVGNYSIASAIEVNNFCETLNTV